MNYIYYTWTEYAGKVKAFENINKCSWIWKEERKIIQPALIMEHSTVHLNKTSTDMDKNHGYVAVQIKLYYFTGEEGFF